jgi:hypothetical protein
MKDIVNKTVEKADNRLRTMCDGLSPRARLVAVIVSLVIFATLAIYMAVYSVYGSNRQEPDIQHIEGVELKTQNESINNLKISNYDDDDE